jgi:hypothetical protein
VDDSDAIDRSRVLAALKDPSQRDSRDNVDIIIALGMAKEGFDWIVLKHVRTHAERRAAENVANRTPCRDFGQFKPLFERAERELQSGIRKGVWRARAVRSPVQGRYQQGRPRAGKAGQQIIAMVAAEADCADAPVTQERGRPGAGESATTCRPPDDRPFAR